MLLKAPRVVKNWKSPTLFAFPQGSFYPNRFGRQFLIHETAPFREEAFAAFGVSDLADEPQFKNFIGHHYQDGAFTHTHQDAAPDGYVHTRCNWMIKKPQNGGNPVLDNVEVSVEEGDLWLCLASLERHGSTPISGGERLICSFGALVPKKALAHILDQQPEPTPK
jgi:hypothetical protein